MVVIYNKQKIIKLMRYTIIIYEKNLTYDD